MTYGLTQYLWDSNCRVYQHTTRYTPQNGNFLKDCLLTPRQMYVFRIQRGATELGKFCPWKCLRYSHQMARLVGGNLLVDEWDIIHTNFDFVWLTMHLDTSA